MFRSVVFQFSLGFRFFRSFVVLVGVHSCFRFRFWPHIPGPWARGPGLCRTVLFPFRFGSAPFASHCASAPVLYFVCTAQILIMKFLKKSIIHFYLKGKCICRPVRFPFRLRSRLLLCLHHPNRKL